MHKVMTLGFIRTKDSLLLGLKKRGFGSGRWNGFGGKVQEGESIESAMRREFNEECSITVTTSRYFGVITFNFLNTGDSLEVHFFEVLSYTGTPTESEEMKPQWFSVTNIPFKDMWPDDPYWMPLFLAGKKFKGTITFKDQNTVVRTDIQEVLAL